MEEWLVPLAFFAMIAFIVAALFVLPVKAWLRQRDDIDRKQSEIAALDQANAELADEVSHLDTPEGIEEAARQDQAALAAQTVQVGAAAALQRDRHSQHHRGDLIIFLGHIDVLLACKLLNGLFGKFF